jgi:hypothetical protein
VKGLAKVFTQTLRPLRADVKEIPAIELPYFDTDTQSYQIASTKPIPLVVKKANVITASDGEGNAGQIVVGSEVESLNKGIASSYEDNSVIQNENPETTSWLKSPLMKIIITGPPLIYILLLAGNFLIRRRNSDSVKVSSRKAYGRLLSALKEARGSSSAKDGYAMVLDALRNYFGDKLNIPGKSALTFNDIKEKLVDKAFDQETVDKLEGLFNKCEAGRYAGNAGTGDVGSIVEQAELLVKEIEKSGSKAKAWSKS